MDENARLAILAARIERLLAHLFGWHSIACRGHVECGPPPGTVAKIGGGPLGWNRWVGRDGAR